MREVVKKEILKLLHAGIIYPVQDSEWVCPVQVVPKKEGMTVVRKEQAHTSTDNDQMENVYRLPDA